MDDLDARRGALTEQGRTLAVLLTSAAATAVLPHVPYARVAVRPLVWLSTLVHELGHGLTALALGASFRGFQIFPNGSGVAGWEGRPGALGRAAIAAGGLLGPAVFAAVLLVAARSARGARILLGLWAAGLAVLLFKVGNVFTFAFVGALAAVLGGVAARAGDEVSRLLAAFLGVQLAVSVFSRSDYLFATAARTGVGTMDSDTQQMANALWLPAWFWGLVVGAVSLAVLAGGLVAALGRFGRARAAPVD